MENFERTKSKLDNPELIERLVEAYAEELEKMVTEPTKGRKFSEEELKMVNNFRENRKMPRKDSWFSSLLVKVGQDFRLNPDEIDDLQDMFLE